jgi:hypothetical protein
MKNPARSSLIILLCSGTLFVTACQNRQASAPTRILSLQEEASLVNAGQMPEIGSKIKIYNIPLVLQQVPQTARLQLDFRVVRTSHCPTTYIPTEVHVNDTIVETIDFRNFDRQSRQVIDIDVPQGLLRKGNNMVAIHSGECQFDIDVMHFNDLKLLQN